MSNDKKQVKEALNYYDAPPLFLFTMTTGMQMNCKQMDQGECPIPCPS